MILAFPAAAVRGLRPHRHEADDQQRHIISRRLCG